MFWQIYDWANILECDTVMSEQIKDRAKLYAWAKITLDKIILHTANILLENIYRTTFSVHSGIRVQDAILCPIFCKNDFASPSSPLPTLTQAGIGNYPSR